MTYGRGPMATVDDLEERIEAVSGRAAALVVPRLVEWLAPRSVVDLGCNVGVWLRAFIEAGVEDVLGFEKADLEPERLLIPRDRWVPFDLAEPLAVQRTFDLAICIEVAEHVPRSSADRLVDELVRLAPVVLFGAGIPGQGGDGHVNERWGSWWVDKFAARGFERFDVIRSRIWDEPGVQWWYSQNMAVYARPDHPAVEQLRSLERTLPVDVVHPRLFEEALARPMTTTQLVRALPRAARRTVEAKVLARLRGPVGR